MPVFQLLAFLSLSFIIYLFLHEFVWLIWYRYETRKRKLSIPQYIERSFPLGIRRILTMLKLAKSYKLLDVQTKELFERIQHRTTLRQAPLHYQIFTIDPNNIKSVLATNFSDYSLGIRFQQLGPVFGNGIFTLSGSGWKHSRAMLRPQFTREQICRIDQVCSHVQTLIEVIEGEQSKSEFIDIQHYFHLLTMDTATEFLFGESIESLNPCKQATIVTRSGEELSSADFVESYTFLNNFAFKRAVLSKFYWVLRSDKYEFHKRRAHAFIDYYVDRALYATSFPEPNENANATDVKATKNSIYIFALELAKVTRDPVTIRDQIFNILIAGRDTTASTLSFALYYLARSPEIFQKLRAEILDHFGEESEQRVITFEAIKQAPYLKYFVNEVLRLAPVVPLNFREAVKDTVLPSGGGPNGDQPILVPRGTTVHYSVFMMHRDPRLWGSDAQEFKPERWECLKLDNLWSFLPFNGGPRICLGQQFALTEISLTLTRLLQHFCKIEVGPKFPEQPQLLNSLTLMNAPPGVEIRLT